MNVIRHHDPSIKMNVQFDSNLVQLIDEKLFDCIVLKERKALITGKCEKARVAIVLDALELSANERIVYRYSLTPSDLVPQVASIP